MARRPVLIVEGPGDKAAVPRLLRELAFDQGKYDFSPAPNTKMNVEIAKLLRQGEIERYARYAADDPEGDSVVICLDCEDHNPLEVESVFRERIKNAGVMKPVEIILLKAEFETLFLYSIESIVDHFPEYEWISTETKLSGDLENIRNAKGRISQAMRKRAYKPTRDQEKFISALNYQDLLQKSASFERLAVRLDRLLNQG